MYNRVQIVNAYNWLAVSLFSFLLHVYPTLGMGIGLVSCSVRLLSYFIYLFLRLPSVVASPKKMRNKNYSTLMAILNLIFWRLSRNEPLIPARFYCVVCQCKYGFVFHWYQLVVGETWMLEYCTSVQWYIYVHSWARVRIFLCLCASYPKRPFFWAFLFYILGSSAFYWARSLKQTRILRLTIAGMFPSEMKKKPICTGVLCSCEAI